MNDRWSFSLLLDYEDCPHRLALHRARTEKRKSTYATDGIAAHEITEAALQTDAPPEALEALRERSPTILRHVEGLRADLTGNPDSRLYPEIRLALDSEWRPSDWNRAWLRLVADVLVLTPGPDGRLEAKVIDWKYGKSAPFKHVQQLQLYIAAVACAHDAATEFTGHVVYAAGYPEINLKAGRDQAETFRQRFDKRARSMLSDDRLTPKPNAKKCGWCDYGESCAYSLAD